MHENYLIVKGLNNLPNKLIHNNCITSNVLRIVKSISNWNEIPDFGDDEKAEAEFWLNHQLELRLMDDSIHRANVRESTTITLRFDPQMLSRIKRLARHRYLNYQSMIKQWLSERLEEEVRKQEDPPKPPPKE